MLIYKTLCELLANSIIWATHFVRHNFSWEEDFKFFSKAPECWKQSNSPSRIKVILSCESHGKESHQRRSSSHFFLLSLWSDNKAVRTTRQGWVRGCTGGGGSRLGPASALSYAFVRQKHLPVAGAGSRRDAAEVFLLRSTKPAELSGQVGGLSHHPVLKS